MESAKLDLLLLIDAFSRQAIIPTAASLSTGWLSPSLLRRYVRELIASGHITRYQPRGKSGRRLHLTASGHETIAQVSRELQQAIRALWPSTRTR